MKGAPRAGAPDAARPGDKAIHRIRMQGRRAAVGPTEARRGAKLLQEALPAHPLVTVLPPGPVLVPVRHGHEIDTAPLARHLEASGWTLCRPRTDAAQGTIEAVPHPFGEALVPGHAGVAEPPSDVPAESPAALRLVLVPGLAFDRHGHRIGYGGGFFDRFLAKLGNVVTIGIGYRFQLLKGTVPTEPHDIRLAGLQLEDLTVVADR